jgi:hypothetical protein
MRNLPGFILLHGARKGPHAYGPETSIFQSALCTLNCVNPRCTIHDGTQSLEDQETLVVTLVVLIMKDRYRSCESV